MWRRENWGERDRERAKGDFDSSNSPGNDLRARHFLVIEEDASQGKNQWFFTPRFFTSSWPEYKFVSITIPAPCWKLGVKAHFWQNYLLICEDVEIRLKDNRYFPWVEKPLLRWRIAPVVFSSFFPCIHYPDYLGSQYESITYIHSKLDLNCVFITCSVWKSKLTLKCQTCSGESHYYVERRWAPSGWSLLLPEISRPKACHGEGMETIEPCDITDSLWEEGGIMNPFGNLLPYNLMVVQWSPRAVFLEICW